MDTMQKWDNIVKPAAMNVIECATVDKECINYFIGKMIWAVEHDLADHGNELGLNSLNSLLQIKGVFARNNTSYFENVHANTPIDEIERMHKLSELIDGMLCEKEI